MTKQKRGFASMSKDRQREIASKGGRAAHKKGTAHEWNSEEAKRAGSLSSGKNKASYMDEMDEDLY